jgi:HEAT repeat protein
MEKAKGKNQKAKLVLFFALFVCFPGNSFAQNLEILAEQVNRGNVEQKRNALFQIRNLKSAEASRLAIPALRDAEIIVRATAAFSVIFLPEDEAARVLLPLLQDKSELVRRETAYALGEVGNPSAVNPLLQILQRDKILEVRSAAVVALGNIGDVSAVDYLTRVLQLKPKTEEEFMRSSAAKSIGQIAQSFEKTRYANLIENFPVFRNANNLLINILQNPREAQEVKREAAFALGAIGDESALPVLRANLSNQDYYLAEISEEAIRKISLKKLE